jgi:hypothetical protein
MFGYIAPLKCELKVRDLNLYNAYYCGLCRAIGKRYGHIKRIVLNYDCTFLALLLSGVTGASAFCEGRCGFKPFSPKKTLAADSKMLDFAADINILLAYFKSIDDWRDERRLKGLIIGAVLKGAARKALKNCFEAGAAVQKGIADLSEVERSRCDEPDKPALVFADMMKEIMAASPVREEPERTVLGHLGFNLGRWIYLIDAWDDREHDRKSGSYNPFNFSGADPERASRNLHYSLNEAMKVYDLLDVKDNKGVLDNIIYIGCSHRTEQLLEGKHESI